MISLVPGLNAVSDIASNAMPNGTMSDLNLGGLATPNLSTPESGLGDFGTSGVVAPRAGGGDFAAVLGQAMQGVAQSVQTAETVSMDAMKGQADIREVVDAVMAAERQMTAATAIRDKITTAYLEISRMAI